MGEPLGSVWVEILIAAGITLAMIPLLLILKKRILV